MIDIPDNYFLNLSSYEEFLLKCTLIGEEPSSKKVLKNFYTNRKKEYFLFVTNGSLCILDRNGVRTEGGTLDGSFWCDYTKITTLKGCFNKVNGSFDCSHNKLSSLKGCPTIVGGNFQCSDCGLSSLEGCPEKVGGYFNCAYNALKSLKHCPDKIGINFHCGHNLLSTLEGGPSEVSGYFDCSYNPLVSLKGAPSKIRSTLFIDCTALSKRQKDAYRKFLRNPTPDLMDETGHYCPKE